MSVMSNTDQLVRSTAQLISHSPEGKGFGSGLLMELAPFGDHRKVLVIATNRHVVEGAQAVEFSLPSKDGQPVKGASVGNAILTHPDNEIDLAIVALDPNSEAKSRLNIRPVGQDLVFVGDQLANLNAIEDVVMIGYPNGIIDQHSLFPISRRGITATPAYATFNGRPEFMIDCACFPGSSGSPVFLLNEGIVVDKQSNIELGGRRIGLLGFLYAGPTFSQAGEILPASPPETLSSVTVVEAMMHLGFVVKAEKVLDFLPIIRDQVGVE